MNLLNKLTIKNLILNKKRTIVTIIGIILSIALICAVSSMYASGIASLINFEIYEKGNYHVSFYNVLAKDAEDIKNNRDVESAYITKNIGYANLENSQNEYKPYTFVKAFTKKALNNLSINLVSGRLPQNDKEIVIPTHLKTNGRIELNVGDTITLDIGRRVDNDGLELSQMNPYELNSENDDAISEEQIVDTKKVTYQIVGTIERPDTNIEPFDAPGYTFITYMDEYQDDDIVDVFVRLNKKGLKEYGNFTAGFLGIDKKIFNKMLDYNFTEEEYQEVIQELSKAKYEYNFNTYLISLETNPFDDSTVGSLSIVILIVILIIIVTSVFCIKNSFDISITEKIKQYGMLRSIGATKKQIKKNVFYEASILGLIGIPLGILSGIFASYILIIVCNYFMKDLFSNDNMKLIFAFSWGAIIISILLGMITLYLSAFSSAKKASKVSPISSIKNSANIKIKSKSIKGSKIIHQLFGIGGDISYKNLKRNKRKYRTTVISIIVSVTTFIALSSFMNMAFKEVKREFKSNEYNLYLRIDTDNIETNNLAISTTNLDNIKEYTIARSDYLEINNPKFGKEYNQKYGRDDDIYGVSVIALGQSEYQKYIKSLNLDYEEVKDKGILFNTITIAEHNNETNKEINHQYEVFDYKSKDIINGVMNNQKIDLEIAKVVKVLPFGFKNSFGSSKIIVSDEYFDNNCAPSNISIFYLADDANKVQDEIDEILKDQNYYYLYNSEENKQMMDDLYTLIGIFLYGFIIVITLIGITNMFNTITTNMALRKGEFAMLKSIGMTKKEFNRMIRLESLFMGVKSLIFGSIFGTILSYLMFNALKTEGETYTFPFMSIIICTIGVMLLISIIMKYSINKINKQNIIETIRNENI